MLTFLSLSQVAVVHLVAPQLIIVTWFCSSMVFYIYNLHIQNICPAIDPTELLIHLGYGLKGPDP